MMITVKVKVRSQQQKIEKSEGGIWLVSLKSPPIDGKANEELITLIAKEFKVKKSQVIIKKGLSNPHKIIDIVDS